MIELIIFGMVYLLTIAIAAICSAAIDVLKFFFEITIFNRPQSEKKIFGFRWNDFFGSGSWRNKYINRDPDQGIKYFKILFLEIDSTPFSDGFHLAKLIQLGAFAFGIVFFGIFSVSLSKIFELNYASWPILGIATIVLFGIEWQIVFSNFFYKIFIKKNNIRI